MKLEIDHLSDDDLHLILIECVGPFAVERQGETFEADSIVEVIEGNITFAVGTDRITVARSDIIRLIPGVP